MFARTDPLLVNFLAARKVALIALLFLLAPGVALAMGPGCPPQCGGSGGGGGTGGTGGTGGGPGGADYDVVIVGAGVSGLYAAYELNNMGFSIKVLEARPRHGGNVWSQTDLGPTIRDVIAEGITGPSKSNWHNKDVMNLDKNRLVQIFTETEGDDVLYSVGGTTILSSDVTKKGVGADIYNYWDFYYEQEGYTGPEVDVESYVCDTLGVCRDDPTHHLYVSAFPGGEWMTPLDTIGMRSLAEQEKLWTLGDGEWAFLPPYSWIGTLEELYFNQILDTVQLSSTVTDIDTSGDVAEVSAVVSKCSDCHNQPGPGGMPPDDKKHPRDIVTANAVVVTVSLGVLKAGDITFTPALSAAKQAAIDGLGFGNGGKIQLQFDTRVLGEGTTMFFTPDGICGYGWSYEYKGGDGAQQLVCYTVGENALNAGALGDDAAVIAAAVSDLDNLYAGTPFTDAFVAGYWKEMSRMRNSKGGYSYPTLYSYPTDGGPSLRVDLAAPESTKLYFAGEATSNENSANVTGAMETGLRAAGEIDADHNPQ